MGNSHGHSHGPGGHAHHEEMMPLYPNPRDPKLSSGPLVRIISTQMDATISHLLQSPAINQAQPGAAATLASMAQFDLFQSSQRGSLIAVIVLIE